MQVELIEQTDQVSFTRNPVTQNKSTSALFPGKICTAFDQRTSSTSATITTAADGIFVPASIDVLLGTSLQAVKE